MWCVNNKLNIEGGNLKLAFVDDILEEYVVFTRGVGWFNASYAYIIIKLKCSKEAVVKLNMTLNDKMNLIKCPGPFFHNEIRPGHFCYYI